MGKHGESAEVRPVSNHTLQAEFTTTLSVYLHINGEECKEISISTPICYYHTPLTPPLFYSAHLSPFLAGYVTLLVTVRVGVDQNMIASPFISAALGNKRFYNTSEQGNTVMLFI